MKRTWYKIIFGVIKKITVGLLFGQANLSNHNTLNDLSNNVCIPNKTLTKHLSCGYKGRFHGKKYNSN